MESDLVKIERGVRSAGAAVYELIESMKSAWSSRKAVSRTKEEEADDDPWPEVQALVDSVDSFVAALEVAARADTSSYKGKSPKAPLELVSLRELASVHTALEICSAWGVGLVSDSRPLVREWSRSIRLPRSLLMRYRFERTSSDSRRQQRLLYTFQKVCSSHALAPVAPRFATEMVALALDLGQSASLVDNAAWSARAARELLHLASLKKSTRINVVKLLTEIARRDVYAILNEFCGDDELAAETGGDAPAVLRNIANALAAIDQRDDISYVKQVSRQLTEIAAQRNEDPPRANAARTALARFGDLRTIEHHSEARHVLLDTVFESIFSKERPIWWRGLLTRDDIPLASALYADCIVVKYWRLAISFMPSEVLDINAAAGAVTAFAAVHPDRVAKALDVVWEEDDEPALERLEEILRATNSSALVGALFAHLIQAHLQEKSSLPRLRAAATVAQMLDAGTLETSGISILQAVAAVLTTRAQAVKIELSMEDTQFDQEDDDVRLLEQVSLGTLLTILQLGSAEREESEEKVLRDMLPALEILSSPVRANDEGCAGLAADCRVLVITRRTSPELESAEKKDESWTSALAAARRALRDSEMPSERARAIVTVSKFARAVARRREESHKVTILDMERNESEPLPGADDWQPVAEACVEALADPESYVYLAAAHSLVALADAHPVALLAFIAQCLDDNGLERLHMKDRQKAEIVQARLAEALSHSIRRRGDAAPAYVKLLALRLVVAARPFNALQLPNDPRARCAAFSALADLSAQAKYAISSFLLDLIDLVSSTIDREAPPQFTRSEDDEEKQKVMLTFLPRRAAAFLGRSLLEGNARAAMLAQPRPLAAMCKKLRRISLDLSEDAATRHHALFAMAALDTCLAEVTTPNPELRPRDILPMANPNWLVNTHQNQFDFIEEIGE